MKFSTKINSDYLAVGISLFIITVCSALLYADYTSKVEAGDAVRIGTITYKKKVAQRKYSSQVIWEDLEQNVPVYNNDSIRTADLSEAIIKLSDGTNINLDENSLILLATAGEGININFSHGSISANREGVLEGEAPQISIQSKDAVVLLEKGDVKLSKTGEGGLDVVVTDGKADVKTGTVEKTVLKDEKVIITGDAEAKVVKLRLKPASPPPNENLVTADAVLPVNFTWEPVEGGGAVYLEIARDSDFNRGVVTRASDRNSFTEYLGEGSYYWRIRASNAAEYSDVRKISVIRDQPIQLIYPRNNEIISYSAKPPTLNFRWEENRLASEYIVEISRDPIFKRVDRSITTQLKDISVDRLEAGTYYWRVRTRNLGIASYRGMSPASGFRIDRIAVINPPSLISPPDGKRVSVSMLGRGKGFIFSWSADSQIKEYIFTIATDEQFRNTVIRIQSSGNFYTLGDSLSPGRYYWRVGVSPGVPGKEVVSQPRSLSVIAAGTVTPGAAFVTAVTNAAGNEKHATVRFPWTVGDFTGVNQFEFARDRGFLNIIHSKLTPERSTDVENIPPGVYYWRVRLLDDDRSQIAESVIQPIFVSIGGALVGSADEIIPKKSAIETAREEAELKKKEELARKQQEELARKQQGELARKQQGELARKQQEELNRKEKLEREKQASAAKPILLISSSVKGSAIYMNSQLQGYDTVTVTPPPGVKLTIEVKAEGFAVYKEDITVNRGETKRIDARLVQTEQAHKEKYHGSKLRWRTNLESAVMSRPVYQNNMIVTATKSGFLVGLSMNGRQLWRSALGSVARSTPAADKSAVYVVTVNGLLHSVNIATGRINWKKKVEGPLLFGAEPIVEQDRIFIATSYGVVQAFFPDGAEVWRRNLEEGIFSSATFDDGVLYVGTDRARIYAIDAKDGSVKWTFDTDSRIFTSSPKVYRGTLFVGCYSGMFFAVNARSGWLRWKFNAKKAILTTPAFFGDAVYFGSEDGMLYALKISDGGKLWEFNTRGSIIAGPDVSRSSVLIPSGRTVFSVDLSSGELNWKEGLASGVNTPVTVVGNAAFVGLDNGEVVSLSSL